MRTVLFASLLIAAAGRAAGQEASWPDLAKPAPAVGGGENDAAVVVGIEGYTYVGPVPGADRNARQWYQYLTDTRGVPPHRVRLLTGVDATRDDILEAASAAAGKAGPEGTLWFVFIGHGAPAADGKDGLLLGVDAQQKADSLERRGVRREKLLKALAATKARGIAVVLDACFSGRRPDGAPIVAGLQPLVVVAAPGQADPRMVVLTAAKGDQFAGPLPGSSRPAFSYLVLGGLRGWASDGAKKALTAGALWRYASDALDATLHGGRKQTPDLAGGEDAVLAVAAGERGPNLARLAEAAAGSETDLFRISSLPSVPKAQAPEAVSGLAGSGADWRGLDVDALGRYDETAEYDKGSASPSEKARKWRDLASNTPKFADKAAERAAEWERYVKELEAQEEARRKRDEARDLDWGKLGKLLAMKTVVPEADKKRWAMMFVSAYGKTSEENPYVEELSRYLPPGTVQVTPGAKRPAPRSPAPSGAFGTGGLPFKAGLWTLLRPEGKDDVYLWTEGGAIAVEVIGAGNGWWRLHKDGEEWTVNFAQSRYKASLNQRPWTNAGAPSGVKAGSSFELNGSHGKSKVEFDGDTFIIRLNDGGWLRFPMDSTSIRFKDMYDKEASF